MPATEPFRAWATFQFTAASGRVNECDVLIAVPGGLYLLELKGHPGRVVNHGDTWQFHGDRLRTLRNPLHLTDLKAKELKGQLERAARTLGLGPRDVPFIKPAVFLHDPGLVSELDEFQRTSVYGRNEGTSGLPKIWDDLLGRPPERESWRITPVISQRLVRLMQKIGISHSTAHLRFGDDWKLEPRALDAGPGWEDRLAVRDDGLVQESGRVRIYLAGAAASEEQRAKVDRAARREYQVLQGINHRGIVQAVQIREHQGGPAILFRHRESDLRLDAYLDAYGGHLTPGQRLDLVRQLAEAVRYAHNRSLYHRALAARSVYASAREDGSAPVLRIADWQTAARDFETTLHRSLGDGRGPDRGHGTGVSGAGDGPGVRRSGRPGRLRARRADLPAAHGPAAGGSPQRAAGTAAERRRTASVRGLRLRLGSPRRPCLPGHGRRRTGPSGIGRRVPGAGRCGRDGRRGPGAGRRPGRGSPDGAAGAAAGRLLVGGPGARHRRHGQGTAGPAQCRPRTASSPCGSSRSPWTRRRTPGCSRRRRH
jgi:hypothetical protein